MSNQTISLELTTRDIVGKRLNNLRKDGLVPAVIHDHGKQSAHVMGDYRKVTKVFQQAGKHHPVDVNLAGKKHLVLIKDVDFGPVKHEVRHVVFQAIKQNEEVDAEVPVTFKVDAEIPAEKVSLMVLKQLDVVQVKALPRDLPDVLEVDPSVLSEVGDSLTVADIVVPSGVVITNDPEQQITIVEMPKDQIAEANAAAESLAEDAGKPDAETLEEAATPVEDKDNANPESSDESK